MESWVIYAIIGAVVAFIPGASFLLILLEGFMVSQIAHRHNISALVEIVKFMAALVTISVVLKGAASILHVLPVIGQFGNSLFAFGFIWAIAKIANQHFANKAAKQLPVAAPAPQAQYAPPQAQYVAARPVERVDVQQRAVGGAPAQPAQRQCPQCHAFIDAHASFCGYCGTRVAN